MSGSTLTLIQSGKVTLTYSLLPAHVCKAEMSMAQIAGVEEQVIGEACRIRHRY